MLNKTLRSAAVKYILSISLIISMTAGCDQTSKKPSTPQQQVQNEKNVNPDINKTGPAAKPQLAPEVGKYQEEPAISLYHSQTGAKEEIKLEKYIQGVVAGEIGPEFPPEALKAQAVVARSMTLALIEYENGTRGKHGTDASDDHTEFQAYNEKAITPEITKAVEDTRGQVMTYNGKFAYSMFHAVSDGLTASMQEAFPKLHLKTSEYIGPVPTDGIKIAPEKYRNWSVKIPAAEIKQIMGEKAGNLENIRISERGPSDRAFTISAGNASISAVDLREKIGFDRLFSTCIKEITQEGDNIVFNGSGWGHGAGMEQWGAKYMADNGKDYQGIIKHYFPKIEITALYK